MGAFKKQHVAIFVFTTPFLLNFVSSTYLSAQMDFKCSVEYNYTLLMEDGMDQVLYGQFADCSNVTLPEDGRTHTVAELQDCVSKCSMLKTEMFNEKGKFAEGPLYKFYEKYSNATSHFISRVAKVINECVTRAEKEVENLKPKDVNDCTYFGLFDVCAMEKFFTIYFNATLSEQFCSGGAAAIDIDVSMKPPKMEK